MQGANLLSQPHLPPSTSQSQGSGPVVPNHGYILESHGEFKVIQMLGSTYRNSGLNGLGGVLKISLGS